MSPRNIRWSSIAILAVLVVPVLFQPSGRAEAHEIPNDVTVRAFLKPDGDVLRFLVRVPLGAMRDMNLPMYGPGFIDFGREDQPIRDAATMWIENYVRLYENDRLLESAGIAAARITIPSDRSFGTYEEALAHMSAPRISPETELVWDQALLDVLLEYPIQSAASDFSIDPALAHLGIRTNTILQFVTPEGVERVFQYPSNPGLVRLDPGWYQASATFVRLGFFHILEGIDHLLFVLCLVIPFRRLRPLIAVVTSFTVAHSITLIASAFGMAPNALWFPPLIETLIALSIVYMAFENIVGANVQRRWMMAFGFGLVHGFGFSFLLRESLQFAGGHLFTSLLAFNVGVELGQIAVLLVTIPALELLFRKVVQERMGTILLSALVAHTSWHWMTERGSALLEYQFTAPVLSGAFLAASLSWLMLLLVIAGVVWGMYELFGKLMAGKAPSPGLE